MRDDQEGNLIQLSSVRDRWITEIRSANITTDATPAPLFRNPRLLPLSISELSALGARLSSGLIEADVYNKVESH